MDKKRPTKWTDEKVRSFKLPEGKREHRTVVDFGLYLFLRQKSSGELAKQWQYRAQVNGARRWLSLGSYPAVGLAEARRQLLAHQTVQQAANRGEADHPALVARVARKKASEEPTVSEAFEAFLDDKRVGSPRTGGKPVRERTLSLLKANFDGDIRNKAGDVKISKVTQELIQATIDAPRKRGAPSQASQVYKTWRGLINYAKKRRYIHGFDPMDGIDNPKPYRPAPVVAATDAELIILYKVLSEAAISPSTRLAFELQLLTGARPDEAVSARLSEFDTSKRLWTIPTERVKTRETFSIYLSDEALAIVEKAKNLPRDENPFLFPGRGKGPQGRAAASRALNRMGDRLEELGCRRLKPHDLRRTFRTMLSRLGVPPHIAERCINHKELGQMQRVYDGYDYFAEMKAAWEKAGAHITSLKNGGAQVIPIFKSTA